MKNKINNLNAYLTNDKIDLFIDTGTHLNSNITHNMIKKNYRFFRYDRNSFGGGVIVGVKCHLKSNRIYDIMTNNFESVFVELIFKSVKYLFCAIYLKPNPSLIQIDELNSLFKY